MRQATLLSVKTVVRCRDFDASRRFYSSVLGLPLLDEWSEPQGRGAIFACGLDRSALLEIYQMTPNDPRYNPVFMSPLANDKIDIQLRTDSVHSWVGRLREAWPFDGPEDVPWGQRWIKLRDPDGLLIAIYEERGQN